eukprot:gene16537-22575_t
MDIITSFLGNSALHPYMDEEFHTRQTSYYCNGNFSTWDAKITTFPGLYYVTYFINCIVNTLLGNSSCDISRLRTINFIFSLFIPSLVAKFRRKAASLSIFVRQTNAVWLLFVTGTRMLAMLKYRYNF